MNKIHSEKNVIIIYKINVFRLKLGSSVLLLYDTIIVRTSETKLIEIHIIH